jgi:hypothetical protein
MSIVFYSIGVILIVISCFQPLLAKGLAARTGEVSVSESWGKRKILSTVEDL